MITQLQRAIEELERQREQGLIADYDAKLAELQDIEARRVKAIDSVSHYRTGSHIGASSDSWAMECYYIDQRFQREFDAVLRGG